MKAALVISMINVHRRENPPSSLLNQKTWRSEDTLDALFEDFEGKCYICECVCTANTFDVDHFHPRSEGGGEYVWSNLHPACNWCNNGRPRWKGPMLDPANPDHDVQSDILYDLADIGHELVPQFSSRDPEDELAFRTVEQLNHIHQRKNPKGASLRQSITMVGFRFLKDYIAWKESHTSEEKQRLEAKLKIILSRRAPFTMLIRSLAPGDVHRLFD